MDASGEFPVAIHCGRTAFSEADIAVNALEVKVTKQTATPRANENKVVKAVP
jgi:hypothetical protein